MKRNNGITMIALIVTIIVMLILVGITLTAGEKLLKSSKRENIVTTMLLIKGKTKIIKEKKDFGDVEQLTGIALDDNNEQYSISPELQTKLNDIANSDMYILTKKNLEDMNIYVEVDNEKFYIVDYNNDEIYYSLGYKVDNKTCYSLTELDEEE